MSGNLRQMYLTANRPVGARHMQEVRGYTRQDARWETNDTALCAQDTRDARAATKEAETTMPLVKAEGVKDPVKKIEIDEKEAPASCGSKKRAHDLETGELGKRVYPYRLRAGQRRKLDLDKAIDGVAVKKEEGAGKTTTSGAAFK